MFFFFNIQKNYCVLFNGSKYIVQKHPAGGRFLLNLCVGSPLVECKAMTRLSIALRLCEVLVRLIYRGKQWAAPIHIASEMLRQINC